MNPQAFIALYAQIAIHAASLSILILAGLGWLKYRAGK
jgi:hypothetical protein